MKRRREKEETESKRSKTVAYKPVLTFYPGKSTVTDLTVKLESKDATFDIVTAYPTPWVREKHKFVYKLKVNPDGSLVQNGRTYPYLFYEFDFEFADFVSKTSIAEIRRETRVCDKSELANYLSYTLTKVGLTNREVSDFIVFWVPKLMLLNTSRIGVYFVPRDLYGKFIELETPEFIQNRIYLLFYAWEGEMDDKHTENKICPMTINPDCAHVNEWGASIVESSAISPQRRVYCFRCNQNYRADEMELVEKKGEIEARYCAKCACEIFDSKNGEEEGEDDEEEGEQGESENENENKFVEQVPDDADDADDEDDS